MTASARLGTDRLLVAVAQRLQSSLRSTDAVTRDAPDVTLARVGGDEFYVLLDDITDARDAIRVAERLRHALEEPFEVDGNQLFISATTGIAVSTTGYDQPAAIVRDATTALNRARVARGKPVRDLRSRDARSCRVAAAGGNRSPAGD